MTRPAIRPVVIIGAAFGDVVLHLDRLPRSGEDISARETARQVGGCAFNVARALARLEINPIAAIPVGNGEWGAAVEREMREEGIAIRLRNTDYDNGWCLAMVEANKERTFITLEGCEQHWSAASLNTLPLADNPLIYVTGYELMSPPLYQWVTELACQHSLFIDFGPRVSDMTRQQVETLLAKHPLLTLNRDELAGLSQLLELTSASPLEAAAELSERYRLRLICRLDAQGARVFEPGQEVQEVAAYNVKVEDAIAAGDSHCAGVIAGLASHMSLGEATLLGNQVAAIVVSRPGANGAPRREELDLFQQQYAR